MTVLSQFGVGDQYLTYVTRPGPGSLTGFLPVNLKIVSVCSFKSIYFKK